MTQHPLVSIVVPVFNDEATIAKALRSCLAQSLAEIEVICVDDASTDGTAGIIDEIRSHDSRVRLIRQDRNVSAFQSRRVGVDAALADHVLFLDGDDELAPEAARASLARAEAASADLVAFGVTVVERDGRTGGGYERRLRPTHARLDGDDVLRGLFPIGGPARGQLWRFLFRTQLLRDAYALVPEGLSLPRVNDLPLMFLVAALAQRYVSLDERLYRYHFGRGGSGHRVDTAERAEFYASAIDSIDSIRPAVDRIAARRTDPALLLETYESARLSIVGYVCSQLVELSDPAVLPDAIAHLHARATVHDVVRGAARFYPSVLTVLRGHTQLPNDPSQPAARAPRRILLATSAMRTGGISAVIASQAGYLRDAGYEVTIVARDAGSDPRAVPDGIHFVELAAKDLDDRLRVWGEICRARSVDVVIDHQLLYTDHWPEYALVSHAEGASTIGWMHNFVGRPVYDGNGRLPLIETYSGLLSQLVVLSPLDVAYFKLRGIDRVSYVPNPPSPLLLHSLGNPPKRTAPTGRLELVWWGRLEQRTKQVRDLIRVGAHLQARGVDFRLSVIGPDWDDLTAEKFNRESRRSGVGDRVVAVGARRGAALMSAIDAADMFVSTSVVEGYQLTIAEAQSRGLPVIMYDLPWLVLVQNNDGVVSVPQGETQTLASEIVRLRDDPERYMQMSGASIAAAERARDHDYAELYRRVVTGTLPEEFSPEPTTEDARLLLGLIVFFADRAAPRNRAVEHGTSLAARLWRSAAPVGRATITRVPGLRPLAHRAKGWLGLR